MEFKAILVLPILSEILHYCFYMLSVKQEKKSSLVKLHCKIHN